MIRSGSTIATIGWSSEPREPARIAGTLVLALWAVGLRRRPVHKLLERFSQLDDAPRRRGTLLVTDLASAQLQVWALLDFRDLRECKALEDLCEPSRLAAAQLAESARC